MKVKALAEEFKSKGYVRLKEFFPEHSKLIREESIAKYTSGYKLESAPGRTLNYFFLV